MGALLHMALVVCYALVQVANGVPDPSRSVRVGGRANPSRRGRSGVMNGHTYLRRRFQERNKNDPGGGGKCKCPHDYTLKHKRHIVDVTWKCHKEGLCYAQIATIRLNWYQASNYCKNLSRETGIADEWRTGLAAPADMEYLKEIAKAFGHKNNWGTPIKPINITTDRHGNPIYTRPSGPWIAGTDANIEGEWEWKGIADNLKFDKGGLPNGGFFADNTGPTENEDCLEIFNDEGYVNDMDCTLWQFAFVCEAQKKLCEAQKKSKKHKKGNKLMTPPHLSSDIFAVAYDP